MGRRDLTGKTFGDLVVVKDTGLTKNESAVWETRCVCGTTVLVTRRALTANRGMTKSCGCRKLKAASIQGKMNIINHTGEVHGRLTVIRDSGVRASGKVLWLCRCICGKEILCLYDNLKSQKQQSCGCLRTEISRIDLTGQTFGRLRIIEFAGTNKSHQSLFRCECTCGNICVVSGAGLRKATTKSCGCLNNENASALALEGIRHNRFEFIDGTSVSVLRKTSTTMFKNNTSGVRGVCWNKAIGKWHASIHFKKHNFHLGYYENLEDAAKARKLSEDKIYGEFIQWYDERNKTLGDEASE